MPLSEEELEIFAEESGGGVEAPGETLGERYRAEQEPERTPVLKEWYRKALSKRAEEGYYDPVLTALYAAEKKQKNDVYELSPEGRRTILKNAASGSPYLSPDERNTLFGKATDPNISPLSENYEDKTVTNFIETINEDWDYRDPPTDDNGIPLNHKGEKLPDRAKGWTPSGEPYYGEGLRGMWQKMLASTEKSMEKNWGRGTEEEAEESRGTYGQTLTWSEYGYGRTFIRNTGILAGGLTEWMTRELQRPLFAPSLTAEEVGRKAELPEFPERMGLREKYQTGWLEDRADWLFDFVERVSLRRNLYNVARMGFALGSGKASFDDVVKSWQGNWQASRMAYSIGANEQHVLEEYKRRVRAGENPDLVARDMEQPLSQMVGYFIFDPLNVLDIVSKGARVTARLGNATDEVATVIPEVAKVLGKHADEPIDAWKAVRGSDELLDAIKVGRNRIVSGVERVAGKKWGRLASAKKSVAIQRSGLFGHGLIALSDTPDEALEVATNLVKLYSDDAEEARHALAFLVDAVDTPEMIFSESGMEFTYYLQKLLDDGSGGIQANKLLKGAQEFIDANDKMGLAQYMIGKIGGVLDETYPAIDDLIKGEKALEAGEEVSPAVQRFFDNGGKIRFIDRLINRGVNQGFLGKLNKRVSGRVFIGMNLPVATRGGLYDALLTTVELGPEANINSPQKWAQISELWLGFEHPGLTKGFTMADPLSEMDGWAARNSSYKTMGNLVDAIINRGAKADDVGLTEKVFETLGNPGGRMLQYLEMRRSQQIIGFNTDKAMRHLIKKTLPAVDELVEAGMSERAAKSITQRIINKYGDVDSVQMAVLEELSTTGSTDVLKTLDWLPDGAQNKLKRLDVFDDVLEAAESGKPLDEIVDSIKAARDRLLSRADDIDTHHAMPQFNPDSPETDIGTALEGVYKAFDDGVLDEDYIFDAANHIQANRNVTHSISDSLRDIEKMLIDRIRHSGKSVETINAEIDAVQNIFNNLDDPLRGFAKTAGDSQNKTNMAWEFTRRLSDKTEDLPKLKQEIWDFFGFKGDIPRTRAQVQDFMWRNWKEMQKGSFSASRQDAVSMFTRLLEDLQGVVPEGMYDELVNTDYVRAVFENEKVALAMDQAVMIDGVMKPIGRVVRGFMGIDDNANAVRGLASYLDPYTASFRPNVDAYDSEILRIINHYADEAFDSIDDVSPEVAFDAFKQYRQEFGFPQILDDLEDLVGYKPSVPLPQSASDVFEIVHEYRRTDAISRQQASKLVEYISDNTDGTELNAILRGVDEAEPQRIADELTELAENVYKSKLDEAEEVVAQTVKPLSEVADDETIRIYQGRPYKKGGRSLSWTRDLERARTHGDEVFTAEVTGKQWREAVEQARQQTGIDIGLEKKAELVGKEEGILSQEFAKEARRISDDILEAIGRSIDETIENTPNIKPPHDGGDVAFGRHVHESRDEIWATFENILDAVRKNHGKKVYSDVDDNLLRAVEDWFTKAKPRVQKNKAVAATYAKQWRDFLLHDYTDRYAIDAILSMPFNFHFWPTRTMYKTVKRLPYNLSVVNKYMQFRNTMEKLHKDAPPWYKHSLNSNELLGLDMDNPIIFDLEKLVNPFADMMGGFDDPDKRVNWWSSIMDTVGQTGFGYWNVLIQYAVAMGLKFQGEQEAAAKWGGRFLPASEFAKNLTSYAGINEGRGLELDPSIRAFSDSGFFGKGLTGRTLGPYEQNRVVNILSQIGIENPEIDEQALEDAYLHGGPLWDEAIKRSRRKDALGSFVSTFMGIGARARSKDDFVIDHFWTDYIRLLSTSENMSSDEFRLNYSLLGEKYPFMDTLLLGRKGGLERDRAYAYAILSRIPPGMSDDISKAMDFDYDIVGDFYDYKGDLSKFPEEDREKFMSFIAEAGATLAIPEGAVQREWMEASFRYGQMRERGKQLFGENIWEKVDGAYAYKGTGVNQQKAWYDYLDKFPEVDAAMTWQSEYIMQDEVLASYYASLDKLRGYYAGRMYDRLEQEFGSDIFDIQTQYYIYKDSGQKEKAKQYKKNHPELEAYWDRRSELMPKIEDAVVAYGEKLPDGEPARLRTDLPEKLSRGEEKIIEFLEQAQTKGYTKAEWLQMLGEVEMQILLQAYEGANLPEDVRLYFENIANQYNLSLEGLIKSVGTAE